MGLTVDVFIDGARSEVLSSRFRSLNVVDSIGHEADTATLVISVARPTRLALPRIGAEISFTVARDGAPAEPVGEALFTTSVGGDNRSGTVTVEAEAVAPGSALREQRDASWTGKSVGEIVNAIAERAGLVPAVSASLANVVPEGAIQASESDRQFLHRLLDKLNGRWMPKGGRLIVRGVDARTAVSGATLPTLEIDVGEDGSWVRFRRADPGVRGSVSARYYADDGATIETTTIGSGFPRRRLPAVFASRATSESAAQRTLLKGRSSRDWIEIERHLTLEARALYPLEVSGAPVGFSGDLTIQEVRHFIAGQVARTTIRARP